MRKNFNTFTSLTIIGIVCVFQIISTLSFGGIKTAYASGFNVTKSDAFIKKENAKHLLPQMS